MLAWCAGSHVLLHDDLNMIAMIGTSDRPCWLAESCEILLLLSTCPHFPASISTCYSAWPLACQCFCTVSQVRQPEHLWLCAASSAGQQAVLCSRGCTDLLVWRQDLALLQLCCIQGCVCIQALAMALVQAVVQQRELQARKGVSTSCTP